MIVGRDYYHRLEGERGDDSSPGLAGEHGSAMYIIQYTCLAMQKSKVLSRGDWLDLSRLVYDPPVLVNLSYKIAILIFTFVLHYVIIYYKEVRNNSNFNKHQEV